MTDPLSLSSGQGGAGFSGVPQWQYERVGIAAPGAGNDWNYIVPDNKMYEFVYAEMVLSTSVVVANRQVSIRFCPPINNASQSTYTSLHIATAGSATAASTNHVWSFLAGAPGNTSYFDKGTGFTTWACAIYEKVICVPKMRIESFTFGLSAGDLITNVSLWFRSYSTLNSASLT